MRVRFAVVALAVLLAPGCAGTAAPAATSAPAPTLAPAATSAPGATPGPAATSAPAGAPAVPLPPAGRFDYQIGGAYPPPSGTVTVSRDRRDPPAPGAYSICYVNAFQTQPAETAWWRSAHPELVLPVEDPQWPGEFLLDLSTPAQRGAAAGIVGGWIDGCAAAGYRAVEPDNLDSWTRSGGRLTEADALAFAGLLATRAHRRGLAIAQKNAAELGTRGRAAGLDFAVAEECQANDECDDYTAVYGTAVLEIEYARAPFTAACAAGRGNPVTLRDRDVVPAGRPGHTDQSC